MVFFNQIKQKKSQINPKKTPLIHTCWVDNIFWKNNVFVTQFSTTPTFIHYVIISIISMTQNTFISINFNCRIWLFPTSGIKWSQATIFFFINSCAIFLIRITFFLSAMFNTKFTTRVIVVPWVSIANFTYLALLIRRLNNN